MVVVLILSAIAFLIHSIGTKVLALLFITKLTAFFVFCINFHILNNIFVVDAWFKLQLDFSFDDQVYDFHILSILLFSLSHRISKDWAQY